MEKLKNCLNNLNSIEGLASIVEKLKEETAKVKISFLGSRIITVNGYSGSITIDFMARKAMKLFEPLMKDWNYSLETRKNIRVIEAGLDTAYFDSDTLLDTANSVTKFFNWFKELFHIFFSTRSKWRGHPALSDCYSAQQYKNAFPNNSLREDHDEEYKNNILYHPPYEINYTWFDTLLNFLTNE